MASNINPQLLLTRHNYNSWSSNMRRILETEGLIQWITKSNHPTETGLSELEKFKLSQSKAKATGLIKTYCSQEITLLIDHIEEPDVIWTTLKNDLQSSSRSYKSYCLAEFRKLKPLPDEELPTFINRLEHAYRRVEDAGETISEEHRCFMLLEHLPTELDYLARDFEQYGPEKFKFSTLKDEITKEYNRRRLRELVQNSECLIVENSKNAVKPSQTIKNFAKTVNCTYCQKIGNHQVSCRKKLQDRLQSKSRSQFRGHNSFVTEFITECFESEAMPLTRDWILDSASTAHICQNPEFFIFMKLPPNGSVIKMGTTPHRVKAIGTVKFTIKEGTRIRDVVLKDCLYVPSIHKNLISMSKMDKAGLHAKLHNGFKIFDQRWRYLWSAKLQNNFYVVKGMPVNRNCIDPNLISQEEETITNKNIHSEKAKDTALIRTQPKREENERTIIKDTQIKLPYSNAIFLNSSLKNRSNRSNQNGNLDQAFVTTTGDIMLWHERLGHCSIQTIKKMFHNQLVLPKINLRGQESCCEPCILGKNTRQPYYDIVPNIRSKDILQLVHTDVWGPAPYTAKHGYRYILTFLDDYSRRSFCYPMRSKSEVCNKLRNFIALVERQTGKKIRAIRSDNGLEYCCIPIQETLESLGIKHERTNIYSPQSNGCAERLNRTLFNGMRTLLQAANLSDEFWLEAMQTTNYLRNRTLHSTTNEIPFKRWYGRKPSLRHLRRYGCVAYVHVPSSKRTKFDPRAQKGIMIGYSNSTIGYKIYIPDEDKIVETKHVTFDETKLGNPKQPTVAPDSDDEFPTPSVPRPPKATKLKPEEKVTATALAATDDPEFVTFIRYTTKRKSGPRKGHEDIYVISPDGERLRSHKDLIKYCERHNLEYDASLEVFSKYSSVIDQFQLKKKGSA